MILVFHSFEMTGLKVAVHLLIGHSFANKTEFHSFICSQD